MAGGAGLGAGVDGGLGAGVGAGMGANAGNLGHAGNEGNMSMGHSNLPSLSTHSSTSVLSNEHLDTSLTAALGKSGVTVPGGSLQTACSGFKNLGECVAAMHVSQNLGIPFADLQSRMTGSGAVSLGKAIQQLGGPRVNARSQAKHAKKQTSKDFKAAASASASATAEAAS
ncbi:MAG TPA: hypothetical protein VFI20_12050 [Terracidiphilus sp.]|nr:hypothetical protein [Terracidiphilus sp.]